MKRTVWVNRQPIPATVSLDHDNKSGGLRITLSVSNSSEGFNANKLAQALDCSSPTHLIPNYSGADETSYGQRRISFSLDGKHYEELEAKVSVKHTGGHLCSTDMPIPLL